MTTVVEALQDLQGKSIFFEPVGGNHGDTIIALGSRELFKRLNLTMQDDPERAEAIVINGNGAMGVEMYDKTLGGIWQYAQKFSDRPFIMLPSSFYFQGNRLGNCFQNRAAPALVFARERYSFERIQDQIYPPNAQVGLDDDMAFQLRDSEFLRGLQARCTTKHILLVERFDPETATGGTIQEVRAPRQLKQAMPAPVKNLLKAVIHRQRAAQTGFTPTILQRLYAECPQFHGLPVYAQDISSPVGFTFEQFIQAIVDAAVVISTRLHVAVLASLLEKPTFIVTGSAPYPKLKGVYEYSLAHLPYVHLW